jgi:hypothetical protein
MNTEAATPAALTDARPSCPDSVEFVAVATRISCGLPETRRLPDDGSFPGDTSPDREERVPKPRLRIASGTGSTPARIVPVCPVGQSGSIDGHLTEVMWPALDGEHRGRFDLRHPREIPCPPTSTTT